MNNIQLLPTENASKLCALNILTDQICDHYVYITNDEDLVLGGYHFNSKYGDEPQKTVQRDIDSKKYWEEEDYYVAKIIISNDKELTNDGIQEVSDEFISWLQKNEKCKFVNISSETKAFDKHGFCVSIAIFDTDYTKTIYYTEIPQ